MAKDRAAERAAERRAIRRMQNQSSRAPLADQAEEAARYAKRKAPSLSKAKVIQEATEQLRRGQGV